MAEGDLTTKAPEGAHFVYDEVKTKRGTETLGQVPILKWDSLDAAVEHYGDDAILSSLDGTSLRVSFQSIARRFKAAKKSDNEIAEAQIKFKPGHRVVGESTPVSRAKNAAKKATESVGAENADFVTELLKKVAEAGNDPTKLAALKEAAGMTAAA